jgi:hypothetical protein
MRRARVLPKITYVASVAAAGGLLLRRTGLWGSGTPLPVTDGAGRPLLGSLSEKTYLDINGVRQGMFLQGADVTNPVLLYLHGGMPEFFFTERYPTGLEKFFTVAWWDRRGAGLSYDPPDPPTQHHPRAAPGRHPCCNGLSSGALRSGEGST